MKKISVYNIKSRLLTNERIMEHPEQWISDCESTSSFGIPGSYEIVIKDLTNDYDYLLEVCRDIRGKEYPPMQDYLDGVVKNDQAQINKYISDCLVVKTKYPKPIKS